ncbi:MAG: MerR family transcriptional regulator [Butyricicoccus pullicaecorum]|nr:MerR family transcriptional regulator [Butyricicoccus pullicaecorum]
MQNYFSSGEFAKLTGVNKRTLHYYHDIGLFKPDFIGENGYHYYSVSQFAQLEFILTLRRIGLSIEEIEAYIKNTSDVSFSQMMKQKKKLIDDSIQKLLAAQAFLEKKAERIQMGMKAKHGDIQRISLPERKMILSAPITGAYDDADFAVAADFSLRLKKLFSLYDSFGSRISVESLLQGKLNCYDRYFAYCPEESAAADEMIPEGTYLQTFCIGDWEQIPTVYEALMAYARAHHLELDGYAYEEGLNEISLRSMEDYITRIIVRVK